MRGLPDAEAAALAGLDRHCDVLARGHVVEQARHLESPAEAEGDAGGNRQVGDVVPREPDTAGVGPDLAAELVDEGRLAGAVRADQRMDFACLDSHGHVVGGKQAAEALHEAVDLEDRGHHRPPRTKSRARSAMIPPRVSRTTVRTMTPTQSCQYSVQPER